MQQSVIDFIHHARGKGMDHATIRVLLLSAGWKEKDIAHALAEEGLEVEVPEPPSGGGARDAFERMVVEYEDAKPKLKRPLPQSMQQVADYVETEERYEQVRLRDPQTGDEYGYKVTGESTFELCATFSLPRDQPYDMFWNHPAGRKCFSFDILEEAGPRIRY